MAPQFLDYCSAHRGWLLDLIEALVAIESPSDDRAAVNRCGAELASRLEALGGALTRVSSSTAPLRQGSPLRQGYGGQAGGQAGDHLRASFGTASTATCNNWTSSAGDGSATVGHHDRQGGGANPTSWHSAHPSKGCGLDNLRATGGEAYFYCFAAK